MGASNLPPGVSDSDIPGNRPEDVAFENLVERIERDLEARGLGVDDANWIWTAGIRLWELYEKMPHPLYIAEEQETSELRTKLDNIRKYIEDMTDV